MQCPKCEARIPFDSNVFGRRLRCQSCASRVFPSREYVGTMMVGSSLVAVGLLLMTPLEWGWAYFLSFPLTFIVFLVWANTISRIFQPRLELREFGDVTTLELGEKAGTSEEPES